jgi:uncharacterized SAM-binding protein YcdF (DUF218 family)
MDYEQPPAHADMIVVLAGGVSRPLEGAALFKEGWASEIWLSRPYRSTAVQLAERSGAHIQKEEDINTAVLRARNVPSTAIRYFGKEVMSTLNEALALRSATPLEGKTILLVTSRFHLRRAAWIFRATLPETRVIAVPSRFETFTRKWWTEQFLARATLLESAKMVYYLVGGRFVSDLENTPHVH